MRVLLKFTLLLLFFSILPLYAIQNQRIAYFKTPPNAYLMDEMLPQRGILSPRQGLLTPKSQYIKKYHSIDFDTREARVIHYIEIPGSHDSTTTYTTYYRELGSYTEDLTKIVHYRTWLNEFIGQGAHDGVPLGELEWDLPFKVPDWMTLAGFGNPKLKINGSYKVTIGGRTQRGFSTQEDTKSWFPTFSLSNEPSFSVVGSIGRLIHIEINSEEKFAANFKDQLKLSYHGEGDELEDNIIQEIEVGNTSLSLKGTELTGYTENHKGLFGVKTRLKFGNLQVSLIASSEGGSQERQTLGAGLENSEYGIQENSMSLYKHFFLELKDRRDYLDTTKGKGVNGERFSDPKTGIGLRVFERIKDSKKITNKLKAIPVTLGPNGKKIDNANTSSFTWKELEIQKDFVYNPRLRMLTVHSGRKSMIIAARWNNDPLSKTSPVNKENPELIYIKKEGGTKDPNLDPLMFRNVYSIGKLAEEEADAFRLRIVDELGKEVKNGKSYREILGLTKFNDNKVLNYENENIFDFKNGLLILPCIAKTNPADTTTKTYDGHCLSPMLRVDSSLKIYDISADEIRNLSSLYEFKVWGKKRKSTFDVTKSSFSTGGGGCLDITEGTEKLMLNGSDLLYKDIDYEVLYEVGQITLISAKAKNPSATIDISYECTPLFEIQDKTLLGTRLEYSLDNISKESMIGATVLFKNQSSDSKRAQLGREPFRQFLMGVNSRLAGSPKWMTSLINYIPFIETKAASRVNFEFEIAKSFYNPNTKGGALFDDFEQSLRRYQLPLRITAWTKASPPGNQENESIYNEDLSYKRNGQLVWHANQSEKYSRIYGLTTSSSINSGSERLLKLTLRPNDNFRGSSWGGIMRSIPTGSRNQSKSRLIEVVINGREGVFHIDLGQISEDLSIAGQRPNGNLDSEVPPGESNNEDDPGLDGLKDANEKGLKWECKPSCISTTIRGSDPANDNYEKPIENETNQGFNVNGTEGNNKTTGGRLYDTEDLNQNSSLDLKNQYARYSIDLNKECGSFNHCETLENGWRKYQIPLYDLKSYSIHSNENIEVTKVLENLTMIRLWVDGLPNGVTESQLLLARLEIISNAWEEGPRNTEYEIASGYFIDGTDPQNNVFIEQPANVLDSNHLRVSVINNREFSTIYEPSPNTITERDSDTDDPTKEQSLILNYQNFHPGEIQSATRHLTGDRKDLTLYKRLLMEVRPKETGRAQQNRVSFALQIGREDGNKESSNYYEIKIHMDTVHSSTILSDSLWLYHAIQVDLTKLSRLKNSPDYRLHGHVSKSFFNPARGDSSLILSVVGDPSLSQINWMRMVIQSDSNASANQSGEIWVNDLRLEGIDQAWGTSSRLSLQTDFSDFINVSGKVKATNGNFVTMAPKSRDQLTPAQYNTQADYNTNIGFHLNKFFPDLWALSMPLTLSHSGSINRPYTKPTSDVLLEKRDVMDIVRDYFNDELTTDSMELDKKNSLSRLYQSEAFTQRFSYSYKKGRKSKNFFIQSLFERPELQYSYQTHRSKNSHRILKTRTYLTNLKYNLSPYKRLSFQPLSFTDSVKFVPKFFTDIKISPLPERVTLTLFDFSFDRSRDIKREVDQKEISTDETRYTLDMSHGIDLSWRPLNFLTLSPRLSVRRNFNEDYTYFGKNVLFSNEGKGFLYYKRIFDLDTKSDSLDVYGILYQERSRDQHLAIDFSPRLISWLTTRSNFNSSYKHARKEAFPDITGRLNEEKFDASSNHAFKFDLGLNIPQIFTDLETTSKPLPWLLSGVKWTKKGVDRLKLRTMRFNYSINHNYNNEQYTLETLNERNIKFFDFYSYQMGLMYSPSAFIFPSQFYDQILLGKGQDNYSSFDYLTVPMVSQNTVKLSHRVERAVSTGTGITLPVIDLKLEPSFKWTIGYTFVRDTIANKIDTSITWPDLSLKGTFFNFQNKFPALKKWLNSISLSSTYNYKETENFNMFNPGNQIKSTTHSFSPLFKITVTTKKQIHYDLSGTMEFIEKLLLTKEIDTARGTAGMMTYAGLKSFPVYIINGKYTNEVTTKHRLLFNTSYNLKTRKGIQFWRWYVLLKSDIQLKGSIRAGYNKTQRPTDIEPEKRPEIEKFDFSVKPELIYHFSKKIDSQFFIRYERIQTFSTDPDEVTHDIDIQAIFTLRF